MYHYGQNGMADENIFRFPEAMEEFVLDVAKKIHNDWGEYNDPYDVYSDEEWVADTFIDELQNVLHGLDDDDYYDEREQIPFSERYAEATEYSDDPFEEDEYSEDDTDEEEDDEEFEYVYDDVPEVQTA